MGFLDNIPTAQTLDDIPTIGSEPNLAEQQDTSNSPTSGPAAPLAAEVEANLGIDQSLQTLEAQTLQVQPVQTPEQQAELAAEAARTAQAAEAARIAASAQNPNAGPEEPRDADTIFRELFGNIFNSLEENLNEDGTDKGIVFNILKFVFDQITAEENQEQQNPATPVQPEQQDTRTDNQQTARTEQDQQNQNPTPRRQPQVNPTRIPQSRTIPQQVDTQPTAAPTNIDTTNLTQEQIQNFAYLRQHGFNQPQLLRLHSNLGVVIPLETFLRYSSAIVEAALRCNLPPSIMLPFTLATIKHESDFRPDIENSSGFGGLGQHPQIYWETTRGNGRGQRLMQEYPQEYTSIPSRFDPIASIRATVFYYKNILSSIGTTPSSILSYNPQTLARDLYASYNLGPGLASEFKYLSSLPREQVMQISNMPIEQRIRMHPALGEQDIPAYLYQRIANPYNGRSQTTAFDRVQNTYNQYAQILNSAA